MSDVNEPPRTKHPDEVPVEGGGIFQSRADGQLHFTPESVGSTDPIAAPTAATPLEADEPEGVVPPSPLWAMKDRRHEQWLFFGHADRLRLVVGTGDAAVYVIDDGKHHCMIGRRVGASLDGVVYSLVARVARGTSDALVSGAISGAAAFARMQGARLQFHDRLTSYTRFITGSNVHATETLIEAAPQGWWYTAPVPGGRRVVSYMTDADIGRDAGLPSTHVWSELLDQTEHVRSAVGGGVATQDCMVRAAATSHLDCVHGEGWLATGDASAAYDPLAAQGITKALRNGILASYAVADILLGREAEAADRYTSILDNQFASYRRAHRKYFAQERRFPSSLFWSRRQVNSLVEGAA